MLAAIIKQKKFVGNNQFYRVFKWDSPMIACPWNCNIQILIMWSQSTNKFFESWLSRVLNYVTRRLSTSNIFFRWVGVELVCLKKRDFLPNDNFSFLHQLTTAWLLGGLLSVPGSSKQRRVFVMLTTPSDRHELYLRNVN